MAGGTGESGEFGLQIAPMLDILFVLLLFFMVSASIQQKEGQLKTPLPGGGSAANGIIMTISIDASDEISFNSSQVDANAKGHELPELVARLKQVMATNKDQPIVVSPSPSTRQQRVVDVLNACKAAAVTKLALSSASS